MSHPISCRQTVHIRPLKFDVSTEAKLYLQILRFFVSRICQIRVDLDLVGWSSVTN